MAIVGFHPVWGKGSAAERGGLTTAALKIPYYFYETDTELLWYWDGTSWAQIGVTGAMPDHPHEGVAGDGGQLDHGLAMTGASLLDDDHEQYILANGTRALTGAWDVGAQLVTFGAGLTVDGASTTNIVTIPDNMAQALNVVDAGATEYFRIISSDGQPTVAFNAGAADVDFYVSASGVPYAFFIRGSDGLVGIGTNVPSTELEIRCAADPTIRLNETGDTLSYFQIIQTGTVRSQLQHIANTGTSLIDFDPRSTPADQICAFRFFRETDTSNLVYMQGFIGDDTATSQFVIGASGIDTYFCANNGDFGIGTSANPLGKLHVDQAATGGAAPVLVLDQADLSEEMIDFRVASIGAGDPVDTSTPVGTAYARLRVAVNGTFKYVQLYNA